MKKKEEDCTYRLQSLITKLQRGICLEILTSFNRYQYTKFGKVKSTKHKISCSDHQGSVLNSLLFILYVNDLPLTSQFSTTLFAVYSYLALTDKNLSQLEHKVSYQLKLIDQ